MIGLDKKNDSASDTFLRESVNLLTSPTNLFGVIITQLLTVAEVYIGVLCKAFVQSALGPALKVYVLQAIFCGAITRALTFTRSLPGSKFKFFNTSTDYNIENNILVTIYMY